MKTKSLIPLLLIALLVGVASAKAQTNIKALDGIEKKANDAFMAGFRQGYAPINKLLNTLETAEKQHISRYLTYWRAFTHYYASIIALKKQDKENGLAHNTKAIELLKSIKNKNSNEYVLLAMNTSIGISFDHSSAITASAKARNYYDKAIKLDDKNIRAYYGKANSDFYTPKQYGGGLEVEPLALKGLSMKDTYSNHPHTPKWGRQEIYGLLVRYYTREGEKGKAILYCKQGLKKYPNSNELKSALKKLSK